MTPSAGVTTFGEDAEAAADPRFTLSEPLLDAKAVGELLGVKPQTIHAWVRSGLMPCLYLSPKVPRWTRPLLEEWLATRLWEGRK